MVKNGRGHIDHRTLKSVASNKWFDELRRWIEWFVHVDSDGIIFGLIFGLTFKCWGTPAVVHSQSLHKSDSIVFNFCWKCT